MGCFWGPDSLFGAEEGVVRTRVGYAGGEKDDPTYRSLGNHTETILVEFDPKKVSYRELLELWWENHDATDKVRKKQYRSKIFYTSKEQKEKAEQFLENKREEVKDEIQTDILELDFYVAEDYHQKYKLRHSKMMENFSDLSDSEFRDSPLAAKLNGFVGGHLSVEDLEELDLEVEPGLKDRIVSKIREKL